MMKLLRWFFRRDFSKTALLWLVFSSTILSDLFLVGAYVALVIFFALAMAVYVVIQRAEEKWAE